MKLVVLSYGLITIDKYQESKWKLAKIVANLLKLNAIDVAGVSEDSLTTVVIEVKRKLQPVAIYQVLKSSGFSKDLEDPRAFYKNDHGYLIVIEYSDRLDIRVVKGMIERFNALNEIDEFLSVCDEGGPIYQLQWSFR